MHWLKIARAKATVRSFPRGGAFPCDSQVLHCDASWLGACARKNPLVEPQAYAKLRSARTTDVVSAPEPDPALDGSAAAVPSVFFDAVASPAFLGSGAGTPIFETSVNERPNSNVTVTGCLTTNIKTVLSH